MVVSVKESQFLVSENQVDSVSELQELHKVVEVVQSDHWLRPGTNVTDGPVHTVADQHRG